VVFQLLKLGYDSNNGNYFAWDPLAGVSLVDASVVTLTSLGINLLTTPPDVAGTTQPDPSSHYIISVALQASPPEFRSTFLGAF
jgi:hypothetical protein